MNHPPSIGYHKRAVRVNPASETDNGKYCGYCGKPCRVEIIDLGIGAYDYAGARDSQSIIAGVSDCCHAIIYKDSDLTIEYTARDYYYDYIFQENENG